MEHINARNSGDNYQYCHFWDNALSLLDQNDCVIEVSIEHKEFDGFDDVVVYYGQNSLLSAEFQQIKWHATQSKLFGFEDLIKPKFINTKIKTVLGRLNEAKKKYNIDCKFKFITTARIKDGDPLSELISSKDNVLRIDKLKMGKSDQSKMGKIRKCWREHLSLGNDEELFEVIKNFAIQQGADTLDEMRNSVSLKANSVGINLTKLSSKNSGFLFEAFTRNLMENGINSLDKRKLIKFLKANGLSVSPSRIHTESTEEILIRGFDRESTNIENFKKENVLDLLDSFNGRYLHENLDWNKDIAIRVSNFLRSKINSAEVLRITLDAHASISLIAGATLKLKTGVKTELIQFGQIREICWHEADASGRDTPNFKISHQKLGNGSDIALAVNITRPTTPDVLRYLKTQELNIGNLVEYEFPSGPGQASVFGGEHAARLSDQVVNSVNKIRAEQTNANGVIHIFVAAPNSFVFYLGQHVQALGKYQMYEFDFDRKKTASYSPSVCS